MGVMGRGKEGGDEKEGKMEQDKKGEDIGAMAGSVYPRNWCKV